MLGSRLSRSQWLARREFLIAAKLLEMLPSIVIPRHRWGPNRSGEVFWGTKGYVSDVV